MVIKGAGEKWPCPACKRGKQDVQLSDHDERALLAQLKEKLEAIKPPEINKQLLAIGNASIRIVLTFDHEKPITPTSRLVVQALTTSLGAARWKKEVAVSATATTADFMATVEELMIEARATLPILAGSGDDLRPLKPSALASPVSVTCGRCGANSSQSHLIGDPFDGYLCLDGALCAERLAGQG